MELLADDPLCRSGWLVDALPGFRDALLRLAKARHFEHDQVIWQAGEQGNGLIGIRSGGVGLLHAMAPPDSPILHIAGPGFWTGHVALLSRVPVRLTLIARGTVEAAIVSEQALLTLLGDRGDYWREIGRLALQHTFKASITIGDLMMPSSRRRLAGTLLRLAGCRLHGVPYGEVMVSQTELAAMATLSRHSAGPLLANFAEIGLIRSGYRFVTILDPVGLRAIADTD